MSRKSAAPLVLVANPDPVHVGAHFLAAAREIGVGVSLCDVREAYEAPHWRRKVDWWLRGHRPAALRDFSDRVVRLVREADADIVMTTGIAPLDARALGQLGEHGVRRLNFLTDDPWNPEHRAPWFMDALKLYDHVFSPRRANLSDLRALNGPEVSYLPFAFSPDAHHPESPATDEDHRRFDADLVFAGGADPDRVRVLTPFIESGVNVALYGGYWDRYPVTRSHARGFLSRDQLRKAISGAKVALCLVRRANRDGHAMRTFEVAAMGGCMLVEDTDEHRQIFTVAGEETVEFFRGIDDGVTRLQALLADAQRRMTLAERVRTLVATRDHTYAARLREILARCPEVQPA